MTMAHFQNKIWISYATEQMILDSKWSASVNLKQVNLESKLSMLVLQNYVARVKVGYINYAK